LLDVATALADGTPIDWDAVVESAASQEDRRLLAELRFIARIAQSSGLSSNSQPQVLSGSQPATAPSAPLPPAFWGPLRLLEHVGKGSFADVYRAWDTRLDREVALKLLRHREQDEARVSTVIQEGRMTPTS
jgi:serine/threonine protein kinase